MYNNQIVNFYGETMPLSEFNELCYIAACNLMQQYNVKKIIVTPFNTVIKPHKSGIMQDSDYPAFKSMLNGFMHFNRTDRLKLEITHNGLEMDYYGNTPDIVPPPAPLNVLSHNCIDRMTAAERR